MTEHTKLPKAVENKLIALGLPPNTRTMTINRQDLFDILTAYDSECVEPLVDRCQKLLEMVASRHDPTTTHVYLGQQDSCGICQTVKLVRADLIRYQSMKENSNG